jgi:ribosomal protein S18 acetylase RimI-like enzyme
MNLEIGVAAQEHFSGILCVEQTIERDYPASRQTLMNRLNMFSDGFLIVKHTHQLIGYIESCICFEQSFSRYRDICQFSDIHHPEGNILFVIFIGVDERFQKMGVGSFLLSALKSRIKNRYPHIQKIHLVSKEQYVNTFYRKNGFQKIKSLPDYMPEYSGFLMAYHFKQE